MSSRKPLSRPLSKSEGFGHIAAFLRSGQSARQYYTTHPISEWQFYRWKRLYLLEHPQSLPSRTRKSQVKSVSAVFAEVQIQGCPSVAALPAIEIRYPSGVTLCMGEGLSELSILERLLNL